MENDVETYLRNEPRFRERHNKDRGIVNLLQRKYGVLTDIQKETLIAFIQDANSMDRYWRLLTGRYPELRGKDYETKKMVEQRKQVSLGYESGYFEDLKLSKRIH